MAAMPLREDKRCMPVHGLQFFFCPIQSQSSGAHIDTEKDMTFFDEYFYGHRFPEVSTIEFRNLSRNYLLFYCRQMSLKFAREDFFEIFLDHVKRK